MCGTWHYPEDFEERLDVTEEKFPACRLLSQVTRGSFTRQGGTVRAMRRQRVVDVRDADDLGEQRYLIPAESQRVAAAVESFVMKPNDGPDGAERLQWCAQ